MLLATASEGGSFQALAVSGEGETQPIIRYTVQPVAAGTNTPITSILNGRDYDLRVLVEDLRIPQDDPSRGVFAGYTDLKYDKSLTKVRVAEIQNLRISAPTTGQFTLTLGPGQTTGLIDYDTSLGAPRAQTAVNIEKALNNTLGAGTVVVTQSGVGATYDIWFVGQYDVDEPLLTASVQNVTVTEKIKGDPSVAASFTEAFRSRTLPQGNGASAYQNGLSAIDAPDRIDELGAYAGFIAPGTDPVELVRARFGVHLPANQTSASATFTPDFSQLLSPFHDNLVYANINVNPPETSFVPIDQIAFAPVSLSIQSALTAAAGASAIDEDTAAGVAMSVIPLVTKNAIAPAGAVELASFTQPAAGGTVTRLDPFNTPGDPSDDKLLFVPAANFSGTATFTYTARIAGDAFAEDSATGTITVTVNPVNDAPTNTVPGSQVAPEDGSLAFSAAAGNGISVSDVDADPAGVQVTLTASGGTLTLAATSGLNFTTGDGTADGTMTFSGTTAAVNAALNGLNFALARDFDGAARLVISTSDQGNTGKPAGVVLRDDDTIAIAVTASNDAPTVTAPAAQSFFAANTLVFSPAFGNAIVVSDVDAGIDPLMVTVAASGGIGTLTATATGGVQVTGGGTATLTLTGPQTSINATLRTLTLTPPQANASGTLTITANDQGHNPGPPLNDQATTSVTVIQPARPFAVNDAPAGLSEGSATYVLDVLANDLANAGGKPTLASFTQPSVGTITIDNNGTPADATDDKLVYHPPLKNGQPDLDFFTPTNGPPIVFTYAVNESPNTGVPDSLPGTVSIQIANVPDAPVANDDGAGSAYATTIGTLLTIGVAKGLLANDFVVDNNYGDPSAAVLSVRGTTPATQLAINTTGGGLVAANFDGSFSYMPEPHFSGNDTFTYRTHSSLGPDSSSAVVTIHVSAPPTAADDAYTALEDQPFVSPTGVLANDQDSSDGEPLSAVLLANVPAAAGSLTLQPSGIFTFIPAPDFNTTRPAASPVSFTYYVTTPSGRHSPTDRPATVFIAVNEVNDNPTAGDDQFVAVRHIGPLGVDQLVPVLANDSTAPDAGETLSIVGVNGATADASGNTASVATFGGGSVRLQNSQIKYTSPAAIGFDFFTYTVSDGRGGTATAMVEVRIVPTFDFGDAPASYGTTLSADGARHVATGPLLGLVRDEEADGSPTAAADGDDVAASDDEDGLVATSLLRDKPSTVTIRVSNTVPTGGKLDAWIDFNQDGAFTADEKVSDSRAVNMGDTPIAVTVPPAAKLGPTIARLRLSTLGGLGPTGPAADGEVEDHVVTITGDVVVNLPSDQGTNRVSVRKTGIAVEVFDLAGAKTIDSGKFAYATGVVVHGSATQADEMTVDYAFGGLFSLPGGIHLDGGAGGGDLLTIQGSAAGTMTARYLSQGLSLGNAALEVRDGASTSTATFSNFEPLTIGSMASFQAVGDFKVGSDTLTLGVAAPAKLDTLTTIDGGQIKAPSGVSLGLLQTLRGRGTVNGKLVADPNSIIEATGPLALGDASLASGVVLQGELRVGAGNVSLLSADSIALGPLTTLGSAGTAGTLNVPSGAIVGLGRQVMGFGTFNTPLDAQKPLANSGDVRGASASQRLTLTGYVRGVGMLDNVALTGTLSPGVGPSDVSYGSISFSPTSRLIMEMSGLVAGSGFDRITFTGAADLNGTFEVAPVGGYVPDVGKFTFLTQFGAGALVGTFANLALPTLPDERAWRGLTYSASEMRLLIGPLFPQHNPTIDLDVDDDKHVAPSDSLAIINYINAFGSTEVPASDVRLTPYYDTDKDNHIAPGDALAVINAINAGLASEGEGAAVDAAISSPAADELAEIIALLATEQPVRKRPSRIA